MVSSLMTRRRNSSLVVEGSPFPNGLLQLWRSSLPSPTPSSSSSTHLCLMAKGERKVQNNDDSSGDDNASNDDSDSDKEFESPSFDDLVKLLNQYNKIIRKDELKMRS